MDAFQLSNDYVERMADVWPVMATFQGIPGHNGDWNDYGPEGAARARAAMHDYRQRLRALPAAGEAWGRLAADFMDDIIARNLLTFDTEDYLKDLNSMDSPLQHMRMVFDVMDTATEAGWENLVRRLSTIDAACASYRALLEEGMRQGHVVARRQVEAGIEQCRVHASEKSYFHTLPATLRDTKLDLDAWLPRLEKGVATACAAYDDLARFLEKRYLPHAATRDAVGRERYARDVRRFLGADIDAEETCAWGWEQVRAIGSQMKQVAREIDPDASLEAVLDRLKTDPPRGAPTREAFIATMKERQERALAELDGPQFDVPPEVRKVEVKLAPPGGPLGAYYIPPSEDFSRPGSIWYSLGETLPVPLWDQVSTAYHEGFPGHHLQCGLQVSLRDRLSRLQRLDGWSGYAEGWALYTEWLMQELGYYEKPDYVLGMLGCQMMRACRVVIDIGSHLELPIPADAPFHPGERWSFALGVEMLETRAGQQKDHAESEMTRYLGWPAQAISYKVGERMILELRDAMKRRQGDGFVLKEFHNRVLGCGNVALERLRSLVLDDR